MTYWTNDAAKVEYAQDYFASFNSMTSRIIEQQRNIVSSHSPDDWEKLTVEEKEKTFDQHFMLPYAARYKSSSNGQLPPHYQSVFPKLTVDTGQSYMTHHEEETTQPTWRDEHSGPFSWETKSQMNLSLLPPSNEPKKTVENKRKTSKKQTSQDKLKNVVAPELFEKPLKPIQPNGFKEKPKIPAEIENNQKWANGKPTPVMNDKQARNVTYTKPLVHKEPPKAKEPEPKKIFSLPDKEFKMRPNSKKTKSSSRINPRSSVTLDGAIRNLEIAMQEERKTQGKTKEVKQAPEPSLFQFDAPKTSVLKTPVDKEESPPIIADDSLLLDDHSPTLSLSLEDFGFELDSSPKKSGFDFLDNW